MSKQQIRQLIESQLTADGIEQTGIKGVQIFRITESIPCIPAVYEPTVVAIVNGAKEAILDGKHYTYDSTQYLCCTLSMPVEAGSPSASPDNPLIGVYISLDTRVMTDLAIEMENVTGSIRPKKNAPHSQGIELARWDDVFTESLRRLLELGNNPTDTSILADSRIRELYYAILKGDAGHSARRAFGVGNQIARSIQYLSSQLNQAISIDDLATQAGMSRAVFHRKFKQATTRSPIQFVKSMRLNTAAMKIVGGMNINEAALEVGYQSTSQFSREFKRTYGQSPRQWSQLQPQTASPNT